MFMGTHSLSASAQFGYTAMISADFLTENETGYPLLFQSGETAYGKPLHDHQHPARRPNIHGVRVFSGIPGNPRSVRLRSCIGVSPTTCRSRPSATIGRTLRTFSSASQRWESHPARISNLRRAPSQVANRTRFARISIRCIWTHTADVYHATQTI